MARLKSNLSGMKIKMPMVQIIMPMMKHMIAGMKLKVKWMTAHKIGFVILLS